MSSQNQSSHAISVAELARTLGSARHPLVVDVRRQAAFSASQHLICGSLYRPPELVANWSREMPAGKPIVVTCVHGHEVGQTAAAELRAAGFDARYLAGGVEGWIEAGYPHLRKTATYDGTRTTSWITASAAEDRPHRLPLADPALHRSAGDISLRTVRPGSCRGQHAKCDSVRHSRRDILPPRRNLHVRLHDRGFRIE